MKNRKISKLHITFSQFIQRNKHPFPPGKYWIGCPSQVFNEKTLNKLFGKLNLNGAEEWDYDMVHKGHRFACHPRRYGGLHPVYNIKEKGELFRTRIGTKLIVCVPKAIAKKKFDKFAKGWVRLPEEWNVYSPCEGHGPVFFGDFQINIL